MKISFGHMLTFALVTALCLSFPLTVEGQSYNTDKYNIGLSGYDAVSYFNGTPQKGEKTIIVKHNGVKYLFQNAQNKEVFLSAPENYIPQYGGWCAYAMGLDGTKVVVDPKTYKIVDGKLYLFYNRFFNNTLDDWNEDEQRLKAKADKNWNRISIDAGN